MGQKKSDETIAPHQMTPPMITLQMKNQNVLDGQPTT